MIAINKPNIEILQLLAQYQGEWAFWHEDWFAFQSEQHKPKHYIKISNLHLNLRYLYRKDYIGGCDCGCRGDFEITDKGLALLGKSRTKPYSGY